MTSELCILFLVLNPVGQCISSVHTDL